MPLWAIENVPPPRLLAKPPVPLVAEVLTRNFPAAKPLMPPAALAILHAWFCDASKLAAVPLTSPAAPVLASVQRSILNGSATVAVIASGPPTARRSHDAAVPAVPVPLSICQL